MPVLSNLMITVNLVGAPIPAGYPGTRAILGNLLAPAVNALCIYYGLPVAGVGLLAKRNSIRIAMGIPPPSFNY